MNIHFSAKEKIAFLEKRGYEIKQEKIEMAYTVYHNDIEYAKVLVYVPYKDGKWATPKPGGYNFNKEDWINPLFIAELKKKMLYT